MRPAGRLDRRATAAASGQRSVCRHARVMTEHQCNGGCNDQRDTRDDPHARALAITFGHATSRW
jgi:hypothetical protein